MRGDKRACPACERRRNKTYHPISTTPFVCRVCGGTEFSIRGKVKARRVCIACDKRRQKKCEVWHKDFNKRYYEDHKHLPRKQYHEVSQRPYKCRVCGSTEFIITGLKTLQRSCASCTRNRSKKHYLEYSDKQSDRRLQRLYGITLEDYSRMLENQGGGCAICGSTVGDGKRRKLFVDHDHVTGKVRGIICNKCNFGIASFRDNPELMQNAIEYIRQWQGNRQR
jgi:hypothetical protein